MTTRVFSTGNEALAEAAIRAGCRFYTSYPITPQNEINEYMGRNLAAAGGVYIACETEIAGISMVYGAACAGARAMTSSSGLGIALMQECLSAMAAAELPCVVVNISRGGPGVAGPGVFSAQSDYFQATRGGGNGDYHLIVLAPHTVQEMAELTYLAFDLADKHRNPVMILADGTLGQMAEALDTALLPYVEPPMKEWAVTGARNRKRNVIIPVPGGRRFVRENRRFGWETPLIEEKYARMAYEEPRWESTGMEDAEFVLVAYGTSARVCATAMEKARQGGIRVGMVRPITLWPFPRRPLEEAAAKAKVFVSVEMSFGQMIDDVLLATGGRAPVELLTIFPSKPFFSPTVVYDRLVALAQRRG
ncbi:MAG: 3-methyl-2-oxobutanoate dehydrogenase subunit VorB [Chloroflexota bacterium]